MDDASRFKQLKERLARVSDLDGAAGLLSWDQETMMPPGGAPSRAGQMATLAAVAHEAFTAPATGELLTSLEPWARGLPYDSDEAGVVRVNLRNFRKLSRVPSALVGQIAETASKSNEVWKTARKKNDFAAFAPLLSKTIQLQIELARALGFEKNPYDALLGQYEPGLTYDSIRPVFEGLKGPLQKLIFAIAGKKNAVDDRILRRRFPQERQLSESRDLARDLGYDFNRGRLDLSAHPFTGGTSYLDTRITTRVDEKYLPSCVMAVIHEAGHGIHSQGLSPALSRTRIENYGMAVAESQSRFYENLIGRSRPFWKRYFPRLRAAFPALKGVKLDAFYRALNKSEPSLIRVEADEVTYGMHIILRFEIENDLVNGRLAVDDLPAAWNLKMKEYLGVVPKNDGEGVLQDIHWAHGAVGYFPDYLLGSIFSSMLWEAMLRDIPAAEGQVEKGQFKKITAWLGEKIHCHGGKFTFHELVDRSTGTPFTHAPYLRYLTGKYGDIYGFH